MQFACFYSECSLAPRDVFLVLIGCCDCFSSGFKGSLEKRSTYVIPYGIKIHNHLSDELKTSSEQ